MIDGSPLGYVSEVDYAPFDLVDEELLGRRFPRVLTNGLAVALVLENRERAEGESAGERLTTAGRLTRCVRVHAVCSQASPGFDAESNGGFNPRCAAKNCVEREQFAFECFHKRRRGRLVLPGARDSRERLPRLPATG
jgi:hypothetical protein